MLILRSFTFLLWLSKNMLFIVQNSVCFMCNCNLIPGS